MNRENKNRPEPNRDRARMLARGAIAVLLSPYRVFKAVCFTIGLVVLAVSLVVSYSVWSFLRTIPKLEKETFASLQLIATQKAFERLSDKRHQFRWVSLNEVSREYLYSIVFSEDSTFFEHGGFNFEMMANSLAEDLREKKPAFGASTISQQVVKNLFLENEKTLTRKVKEILLTRDLEKHFSKNQILELYLNLAEFGPDLIGVDAAAHHFFRKSPSAINAAEGAFIALMLPSPKRNYYSIYQNHNLTRVKKRRLERVLRDLFYEEFLTEKQYRQYVKYNFFPYPPDAERLPAQTR